MKQERGEDDFTRKIKALLRQHTDSAYDFDAFEALCPHCDDPIIVLTMVINGETFQKTWYRKDVEVIGAEMFVTTIINELRSAMGLPSLDIIVKLEDDSTY